MFLYQLESRDEDKRFLAHEVVRCNAMMSAAAASSLSKESKIVVQLSNRSKYMGIIKDLQFKTSNNKAEGYLDIVKQ